MSTSTPFESKSSYERHFDDMVDSRPLLFRLHDLKPKMPATLFDAELTTLLAARYAPKSKGGVLDLLKCLDETSSPTLDEASVAKHATLWKERSKESEPSEFISLTFNVFWVLWEWKRRMSHRSPHLLGSRDDFHLIVLKSSDLHRPSKLVTEILNPEVYKDAYRFARSAEEVIVPKFIRGKGAILGTTSMSQLQDFVPSWWKEQLESFEKIPRSENEASGPSDRAFTSFQSKLKPPADDGDRARQSLRFALALLAPFIVSNLQRLADIETIVESTGREIDCPQAGGVNIKVDPSDNGTSLGKRKAEQGYVSHFVLSLGTSKLKVRILWRAGSEAVLWKLEVCWQALARMGTALGMRLQQRGGDYPRMNNLNPHEAMEITPWSGPSVLGLPSRQDSPNGSMSVC